MAAPVVGMSATYDHKGYYLVGADGGVFAFGDAQYDGGLNGGSKYGKITYPGNVIGIAAYKGGGYWIMTSTGATYAFGNAPSLGNATGSTGIVSINSSPDGKGYYAISETNQGYNFDDDTSCGNSTYAPSANDYSVQAITINNGGCVMVDAAGNVIESTNYTLTYGQMGVNTTTGGSFASPVVGAASTGDQKGYWMVEANGHVYSYGDAVYNYTIPVKYSQPGGWTSFANGDFATNSNGANVTTINEQACKVQTADRTFVAGQATSPISLQNYTQSSYPYIDVIMLGFNANNGAWNNNAIVNNTSTLYRTAFSLTSPQSILSLIVEGNDASNSSPFSGPIANLANCAQ